jgi:hypothetical protein
MASWSDFALSAPALSESIRSAIHQYGAGLGYLATIRPDGGPRLHPVSPAVVDGGLYCFLLDTPKRRDLERDDRYALHTFPAEETEDESGLRGRATLITQPSRIRRVATELRAEPRLDWWLYELSVETAFAVHRIAVLDGGAPVMTYQKWVDPAGQMAPQPAARAS